MSLIDDLREKRNRISYDGFFVDMGYIRARKVTINAIISKLNQIIATKLG